MLHVIPVADLLALHRHLLAQEREREHIDAMVLDDGIDVQIDWDGTRPSLGHFQVLVTPDDWQACPNIDLGPINDIVSPATDVGSHTFRVRIRRGPIHRDCRFKARAIPIRWTTESDSFQHDDVVTRGKDYEYSALMPDCDGWFESSPAQLEENVHTAQMLVLEFEVGSDHELQLMLQDPLDENNWLAQDPIIKTKGNTTDPHRRCDDTDARPVSHR